MSHVSAVSRAITGPYAVGATLKRATGADVALSLVLPVCVFVLVYMALEHAKESHGYDIGPAKAVAGAAVAALLVSFTLYVIGWAI